MGRVSTVPVTVDTRPISHVYTVHVARRGRITVGRVYFYPKKIKQACRLKKDKLRKVFEREFSDFITIQLSEFYIISKPIYIREILVKKVIIILIVIVNLILVTIVNLILVVKGNKNYLLGTF